MNEEEGHVCLAVPVRKCFPQVFDTVLDRCLPPLQVRRPTTLVIANPWFDAERQFEGDDLHAWVGDLDRDVAPATLRAAPLVNSPAPLLRWAADLIDACRLLRSHGRHVLLVGPPSLPPYESLYRFVAESVADGVIAVAGTWDLHWGVDADLSEFLGPRGLLVTYGDEPGRDLEVPRFHLERYPDLSEFHFALDFAAPLGLWELALMHEAGDERS